MKKLLITGLAMIAFVLSSLAQVDHDYNSKDVVPGAGMNLPKDQIPAVVLKATKVDFNMDNPLSWTRLPYALHEYGWVYDKDHQVLNLIVMKLP